MKRIFLCNFAKHVLTVYQRATSAIRISHKKYQILIVFWLFERQIVFIRIQSNALRWKTYVFLKVFPMAKHVTFPDFPGILVFEYLLKGSIQYLLVQIQQLKNQNNVSNMFKVNNKETRTMLMTLLCCLFWC